ncbi:MAG TPA: hypothetical protein VF806_07025 [Anaerolineaceae bacterium]
MERVTFLVEETSQRLGCLLNPETLVMRRAAGIQPRRTAGGKLTGAGLRDDPLLYTGGGHTELEMDLLFDIELAGSSITTEDVRDLTGPLWELAENAGSDGAYHRPPLVRFIWGKSWNIPGIISAVAERLEYFTPDGVPQRSWMRMRLVRINEPAAEEAPPAPALPAVEVTSPLDRVTEPASSVETEAQPTAGYEVSGAEGEGPESSARLDLIANEIFHDPSAWRLIAAYNDIADPTNIPNGTILRIPPTQA